MNFRRIAIASLLACSAASSFAAVDSYDTTLDLTSSTELTKTISFGTFGAGAAVSVTLIDDLFTVSNSFNDVFFTDGAGTKTFLTSTANGNLFGLAPITAAAGNWSLTFDYWNFVPSAPVTAVLSYDANKVVTAVPEPETYAMMLAGLGAVGFMARRRKSK